MRWLRKTSPELLTEGPLFRAITSLAAPMLVGAVLQNTQNLIDLFWVGRLGPRAIASVAMAGTIMMVLFPMLMGLSTGTIALVARAMGARRPEDAGLATSQSLILALVLGGMSAVFGLVGSEPLFRLLGASPDVTAQGGEFLRILLLGSITVFVLFIGNAALQGAGDTMTPMVVMGISNVVNIVVAPFLIFGLGPLPRMEVRGAAWATVISQTIAAAVAIFYLFSGRTHLRIRTNQWKPDIHLAWRILRIGIPGSGQMLLRSLMSAVMMRLVAACGTAAVAAYGTGMRFHMIILMPAFALGGAAATMVGQNLGAGKPGRARQAAWLATWLDAALMATSAILLLVFAPGLIRVFNSDPDVVKTGTDYLRVVSFFYIFAAPGIVLGRAMNGAGDSLSPMIISVLTLWGLQVPLAVWFSRLWHPATHGIWWAMAVAMVVNGLLIAGWFETGRWMHKRI